MNSRVVWITAILLCLAPIAQAETADDRYVEIYSWIEQGDALLNEGQLRVAAEKYRDAQNALKDLQKAYPGWNPRILTFRLDYVSSKLAQLGPQTPAPAPGAGPTKTDKPAEPAAAPATPDSAGAKLQEAQQQVAWLTKKSALLEAKLKEALSVQPAASDPRELARAEEKIKQLQKEKELLNVTLEQERTLHSKAGAPSRQNGEKNKSLEAQLEAAQASLKAAQGATRDALQERDALSKKLEKTNRELEKANKDLRQRAEKNSRGNHKELEKQLESAQARLAAYEAKAVPLAPDEQALVKQAEIKVAAATPPAPAPAAPSNNGTAARRRLTLPPGAGALFADAERAIDAGRLAEAETKLREILRQDETNVRILSQLGAVLMDEDKTAEAETILNTALALDAEDPASLYLLGGLKLRQEKYDEALTLLSRSAKAEPEMPKTQYFLGRVLFHKGQRAPAETALRKAIQLKPGWGEPHYLLAVIYGTQPPIYRELARFHYKKAIAGGAVRNPELEARIENGSAAVKR